MSGIDALSRKCRCCFDRSLGAGILRKRVHARQCRPTHAARRRPRCSVGRTSRRTAAVSYRRADSSAADTRRIHSGEVAANARRASSPVRSLGRPACRVLVVGAGGTGSAIVMGLPYLHQAMRAWGHGYGLEVTLMDGDTVSETNCARQPFSWSDVGQNKATVLINRINLFWGTKWSAQPSVFR